MVSRTTKHKLLDVLQSIADGENKVEVLRQLLAEKYDFEPYTAFKRIALAPNSYLTSTDLREFLLDNKIIISSLDARDLLKALDLNKDGNLSYSEFLNVVLPKTEPGLRQRVTLRQAYTLEEGERLPYDVEHALARVLEEELNSFQRTESLRRILNQSYDYTSGGVFRALDFDDKNFIIPEDLADFGDDLGRPLSDSQIDAIFRRVDNDLDNRISYSELVEALSYPKSDIATPTSPRRLAASPRRSRNRSLDLGRSYASPLKSENLDREYQDYLYESRRKSASPRRGASPRRSASPKRLQSEEGYKTPLKSVSKFDDEPIYTSNKKSPLKSYEEEGLARSFKEMINNAKLLEDTKNELALRFDFNLFDAFRYFDFYGTGAYISSKQFEEGLADLKLYPTRDEVSLFFKRFDSDYDGLLRFADISALLTPKSLEHARLIDSRKPRYVEEDEPIFTRETERLLAKVFDLAIKNEVQAESIRQSLSRRSLNLYDAFKTIDKFDQGFITIEDFREVLEENGIFATNKDVSLLVERFKGVETGNGKVSYTEFAREMSPKSYRVY